MYNLKPLNYNSLEPVLSSNTINTHYDSHYKKYMSNLNNLLTKNNYDYRYTKEELVGNIDIFPINDRDDILYNLGGVLNHELYFENMSQNKNAKPTGLLLEKINKQYGSYEKFKEEFIKTTSYLVGSGYTFLVVNKENVLEIINLSNQETPYYYNLKPIMTIDLWEHAYYLDYKNNRNLYVNNFFSVVDFNIIENNYEKVQKNI